VLYISEADRSRKNPVNGTRLCKKLVKSLFLLYHAMITCF
jgi:hypothetical protein